MNRALLIGTVLALAGYVEQKAFPETKFREISERCGFTAVTYTPRKSWLWSDEPLIDFSREADPKAAMACFERADLEISKEHTDQSELGVSYIWEVRS